MTLEREIADLTPEQIAEKLGLPRAPTHKSTVDVPAGIKQELGIAGPQPTFSGNPEGGGLQIYIETWEESWFHSTEPL